MMGSDSVAIGQKKLVKWQKLLNFRDWVMALEHLYLILVLHVVIIISALVAYSGFYLAAPAAKGLLLGIAMGFFFGFSHLGEIWRRKDSLYLAGTIVAMAIWLWLDWMPSYDYVSKAMIGVGGFAIGVQTFKALRFHGYFRSVTQDVHRLYFAQCINDAKEAIKTGKRDDVLERTVLNETLDPRILRPVKRDDVFQGNIMLALSLSIFLLLGADIFAYEGSTLLFADDYNKNYQWSLMGAIIMIVYSGLVYLTPSERVIRPIVKSMIFGSAYSMVLVAWLKVDWEVVVMIITASVGIGFSYFLASQARSIKLNTTHRFWQSEITGRQYLDLYRLCIQSDDWWDRLTAYYRKDGKVTQSKYFRFIKRNQLDGVNDNKLI